MRTQTKVLVAVSVLGALAIGTVAMAGPGRRFSGRHERPLPRVAERLGLTEEQRARIKDVLKAHQAEVRPLVDRLIAERRALRELIHSDKLDESALRAQAAKVAAVEADLAVARAKVAGEVRPILSPEQKQRARELKKQAEGRAEQIRERVAKRIAED